MILFSATSTHVNAQDNFEYHFSLEIERNSPDVALIKYLMENDSYEHSHEEMLLSALRAYWMPIAYEFHRTEFNYPIRDDQLQRMARKAVSHLRERAEMIDQHFAIRLRHAPIPPVDRADRLCLVSPRPLIGREPDSRA
jgi:hypothetical protein